MKKMALSIAALALAASTALAQGPAPATLHGTVTNAAGQPAKEGTIKLTTDRTHDKDAERKYQYTFPVGADGTYKGDGIAPGDYVLFYQVNDKTVDYLEHVVLKAGDNATANDDMSREEFLKTMTPEQRKQLEDYKKKNAETVNANKTVANLNQLLQKARDEEKAKDFDSAITDMKQATTQKPDEPILWLELGQSNLGKARAEKDATAKTTELSDAANAFQKTIDTNTANKKPNVSFAAAAYNGLGEVDAKLNKTTDAAAAYDKAAQTEPAKAGMYYFNEAVVFTNANQSAAAATAADKAIAADPARADAYYLKGQALVGNSTADAKTGKITPPPGCVEAYSKYLELAPTGAHAEEVKQIMAAFDEKVVSNYRSSKKK